MMMNNTSNSERAVLLKKLQTEDFALNETVLYLDGHPSDRRALAYYARCRDGVAEKKREFEHRFGPLDIHSADCADGWSWVAGPWPWEKEAN